MQKQMLPHPTAAVAPVPPMLVSCGSVQQPNLVTAAWCGTVCSTPPRVYISLRPERYSYPLIRESGEFVLNLPTRPLLTAVDWCGMNSGRDYQKFDQMGLTAAPCSHLAAPQIAECPLTMECKVFQLIPLGSHDMFLADVLAVHVAPELIENGVLRPDKANLISYIFGRYFATGDMLGTHGFTGR